MKFIYIKPKCPECGCDDCICDDQCDSCGA